MFDTPPGKKHPSTRETDDVLEKDSRPSHEPSIIATETMVQGTSTAPSTPAMRYFDSQNLGATGFPTIAPTRPLPGPFPNIGMSAQPVQYPYTNNGYEWRLDRIDKDEIPTFWSARPVTWFNHLEVTFKNRRITADSTKYAAVVMHLGDKTIDAVEHIINDPPATKAYEAIKEALLKHYCVSEETEFRRLASGLQLGSKRPAQLLNEMRRLSKKSVDEKFLRALWLDRLPPTVQVTLAAADRLDLNELAQLADKVMDIQRHAMEGQVLSITTPDTTETMAQLQKQVTELAQKLDTALSRMSSKNWQRRPRSTTPARSKTRERTPEPSADGAKACRFHSRYGEKARKCVPPCIWLKNPGNEPPCQ